MRQFDPSQPLEIQKRQYQQMVNQLVPRPPVWRNCLWAFGVGGLICTAGQGIISLFQRAGLNFLDAATATSILLVFLAAFLTGLGLYDELARYAGAGMLVPITGFANAMVAPALEARTEGLVLGVGARLFAVAGPILVFGIVTAWLSGLIYYLFGPRPPLGS
ncbi:stage V sporulation protein AC [Ammonifex degensii KC4]|uniref:Stage V sporulation protein AC n=1 Tax=Ammonifex degensii (strain DSM 10501 / KC4) TaxID=429009 RepID=C9R7T0_AMMDK|nr:stage V sporulation protein AC [Ammonifex degensii]ACX52359.1 stage V sporulation protein AC [Ammonifex degensii KC4]